MPARLLYTNHVMNAAFTLTVSSEDSGSPRAWLQDEARGLRWRSKLGWNIVAGVNDKLDFDRGGAAATLGSLLFLKLAFGVLLLLSNPRFVETRKLVILALTSLLANVIVSLLHGFPPRILVSITDAIAAIVVAVLALVWAIVLLVGAVVSIVKLLRLSRGSAAATPG